jgi:hypothetical protein
MQIQRVNRTDPEAVFIVGYNNVDAAELEPGKVVEWFLGTSATQANGVAVELVDAVVNLTTGITNVVAGVAHTTIADAAYGLLQVYGRDTVRSSASLASGRAVVASSINATNIGHVTEATTTTLTGPEYVGAIVGWTIDNSANATNAIVFLKCI